MYTHYFSLLTSMKKDIPKMKNLYGFTIYYLKIYHKKDSEPFSSREINIAKKKKKLLGIEIFLMHFNILQINNFYS